MAATTSGWKPFSGYSSPLSLSPREQEAEAPSHTRDRSSEGWSAVDMSWGYGAAFNQEQQAPEKNHLQSMKTCCSHTFQYLAAALLSSSATGLIRAFTKTPLPAAICPPPVAIGICLGTFMFYRSSPPRTTYKTTAQDILSRPKVKDRVKKAALDALEIATFTLASSSLTALAVEENQIPLAVSILAPAFALTMALEVFRQLRQALCSPRTRDSESQSLLPGDLVK